MASTDSLISYDYINLSDVLRNLKYYMNRIRRENGFDLSGPEKPWGEYTAAKGGSHFFSYYQDQLLESILDSYSRHREGKVYDSICELLASRPTLLGRIRGPLDLLEHQEIEDNVANESTRLILTIAQILIEENGVFLKSLQPLTSPTSSLESSKEHLVIDSVIDKAIVNGDERGGGRDLKKSRRKPSSSSRGSGGPTGGGSMLLKTKNSKKCSNCGRDKPSTGGKPVIQRMPSSQSVAEADIDSVSNKPRRTGMGPALVYIPPTRGINKSEESPRSVLAAAPGESSFDHK